jgi:hypothetical protein
VSSGKSYRTGNCATAVEVWRGEGQDGRGWGGRRAIAVAAAEASGERCPMRGVAGLFGLGKCARHRTSAARKLVRLAVAACSCAYPNWRNANSQWSADRQGDPSAVAARVTSDGMAEGDDLFPEFCPQAPVWDIIRVERASNSSLGVWDAAWCTPAFRRPWGGALPVQVYMLE